MLPVLLAERIFPDRRHEGWLSRAGASSLLSCSCSAVPFAWFSWTQIARVQVFHFPPTLRRWWRCSSRSAAIALRSSPGFGLGAVRFGWAPRCGRLALAARLWRSVWAVLWSSASVCSPSASLRISRRRRRSAGGRLSAVVIALLPHFAAGAGLAPRARLWPDVRRPDWIDGGELHRLHRLGPRRSLVQDRRRSPSHSSCSSSREGGSAAHQSNPRRSLRRSARSGRRASHWSRAASAGG